MHGQAERQPNLLLCFRQSDLNSIMLDWKITLAFSSFVSSIISQLRSRSLSHSAFSSWNFGTLFVWKQKTPFEKHGKHSAMFTTRILILSSFHRFKNPSIIYLLTYLITWPIRSRPSRPPRSAVGQFQSVSSPLSVVSLQAPSSSLRSYNDKHFFNDK